MEHILATISDAFVDVFSNAPLKADILIPKFAQEWNKTHRCLSAVVFPVWGLFKLLRTKRGGEAFERCLLSFMNIGSYKLHHLF